MCTSGPTRQRACQSQAWQMWRQRRRFVVVESLCASATVSRLNFLICSLLTSSSGGGAAGGSGGGMGGDGGGANVTLNCGRGGPGTNIKPHTRNKQRMPTPATHFNAMQTCVMRIISFAQLPPSVRAALTAFLVVEVRCHTN